MHRLDPTSLGDRIRYYRALRGMDEKTLAQRIQRSAATVSRLERGTQNCSVALLGDLAQALDVPLAALVLDDPGLPPASRRALYQLVQAALPLPDHVLAHLTALARAWQTQHAS